MKFVKFLGLLLDENPDRRYHLNELSKKLARTCGIFFKIRRLLPSDVLLCLYNALFLSFLQYGITVWGQTHNLYLDPVTKLQKRVIRAISFQPYLCHSLLIFTDLKVLRLCEIFEPRLLSFVCESVNKISPVCFHTFFTSNAFAYLHQTRQADRGDLYLTRKNSLKYGLKSISYLGCKLWNNMLLIIRNSPSTVSFKVKLKNHLLTSQF